MTTANAYPTTKPKTSFEPGDGKLVVYNYHLDELVDVKYRDGNKYNEKSLKEIEHLFRSRLDNKEHPIDIELVELLDHIQDHFKADCIELISGYRSPDLNRKLKEEGKNVATESLHLEGKAADIHIDEITEKALTDYARSLKVGGVGFYPKNDFVHVDVGQVKNWNATNSKERQFIGIKKGETPKIQTDKNVYMPGEKINYNITGITIEHFKRGKWQKLHKTKLGSAWTPSKNDPFGKYRLVGKANNNEKIISNEFYLKRF